MWLNGFCCTWPLGRGCGSGSHYHNKGWHHTLYGCCHKNEHKQGRVVWKPIATFPFTFMFIFTFARLSGCDWISTRVDGHVLCYYYYFIIIIINIDMCGQILTTQPRATGLELDWEEIGNFVLLVWML